MKNNFVFTLMLVRNENQITVSGRDEVSRKKFSITYPRSDDDEAIKTAAAELVQNLLSARAEKDGNV